MGNVFTTPEPKVPSDTDPFILTAAAVSGKPEELRGYIREYRDYIDRQEGYGEDTPMHKAADFNRLDCINVLLEEGSKALTLKNKMGQTPLVVAAIQGHLEIVKRLLNEALTKGLEIRPLLEMEFRIHIADFTENIFHKLNEDKHIEVLDYLLTSEIPDVLTLVHSPDMRGITPFFRVAMRDRDNLRVVERHLQHNMDSLDIPSKYNWTPVTIAAHAKKTEVVILLRALGANTSISVETLSEEAIALIKEPIPDEIVLEIRDRFYFRSSLTARLLGALSSSKRMIR